MTPVTDWKQRTENIKEQECTCDSGSMTCGASMQASNCTPSSDANEAIGERVLCRKSMQEMSDYKWNAIIWINLVYSISARISFISRKEKKRKEYSESNGILTRCPIFKISVSKNSLLEKVSYKRKIEL